MYSKGLEGLKTKLRKVIEDSGYTYGEVQLSLRQLEKEYCQKGSDFLDCSTIKDVAQRSTSKSEATSI